MATRSSCTLTRRTSGSRGLRRSPTPLLLICSGIEATGGHLVAQLSPSRIIEVGFGFWPSKTLLSAVELGLFTTLAGKAMTGRELQAALGLHARANPDFFDALVALRLLEREGDGPQ